MITAEALSINRIRQGLTAGTVGRHLYLFEQVPSTNSALAKLAKAGAREGTTVLAEEQTAGRGRLGKAWFSPPGVNLYASVLFCPPISSGEIAVFSFIASLALSDAIKEEGARPAIKWPNDILVEKKKVAGVLAESATSGDRVDFVILGAGVNLNVERETLRAALGRAGLYAASVCEFLGREVDRNAFTARFLTLLDEWFQIYLAKGAEAILQAWRDREVTTGRRVEVREELAVFDGRALGVSRDGYLIVQDSHAEVHRVASGEVRFLE